MNHLELLKKYMKHVIFCEGLSMLHHINDPEESGFTAEEVDELDRIEQEIEND